MRHRLSSSTGMTLIEVVIGLLVIALFQPLVFTAISLTTKTDYQWAQRQNQIGVLQMRRKLALGVEVNVSNREVSFILNDQRVFWVCQGNSLVQNPGSMPFLIDLTACEWRKDGQQLLLSYDGGNYHQELIIGILP
jgi:type II secretory pathway pseudopilin PulG